MSEQPRNAEEACELIGIAIADAIFSAPDALHIPGSPPLPSSVVVRHDAMQIGAALGREFGRWVDEGFGSEAKDKCFCCDA